MKIINLVEASPTKITTSDKIEVVSAARQSAKQGKDTLAAKVVSGNPAVKRVIQDAGKNPNPNLKLNSSEINKLDKDMNKDPESALKNLTLTIAKKDPRTQRAVDKVLGDLNDSLNSEESEIINEDMEDIKNLILSNAEETEQPEMVLTDTVDFGKIIDTIKDSMSAGTGESNEDGKIKQAAEDVMTAYQNANKWLDSVKEAVYHDMNCPFFSSFIHELAHEMPGLFDGFGDVLHSANIKVPYPTTQEIPQEPTNIDEVFDIIFQVLDEIAAALNEFIRCTTETNHGLAVDAENCLSDIDGEYPKLYRLKGAWENSHDDMVAFDKFVMQYVEHQDDLLESLKEDFNMLYEGGDIDKSDYWEVGQDLGGRKWHDEVQTEEEARNLYNQYLSPKEKQEFSGVSSEQMKNKKYKIGGGREYIIHFVESLNDDEDDEISSIDDNNHDIIHYKGYDIEYNFYGQNEYTVYYLGDDVAFDTIEEAKEFIDEITIEEPLQSDELQDDQDSTGYFDNNLY